jgi:hypothetical protein
MEDFVKKLVFLTAIFGLLLTFSCKKNEAPQGVSHSANEVSKSSDITVQSRSNPGFCLRLNAGFYSKIENDTGSDTDKIKWLAYMSLGDSVLAGNTRRITFEADGRIYDFIEIRRDNGDEGYALARDIAVGGRLAVVTDEKANLFRSPKAVDVSGVTLPRKNIVAYFPETEKSGFVQIKGYNTGAQDFIRENNNYIRPTSISRKDSDIQSAILLQTALSLSDTAQNRIRKEAMLEDAIMLYSDSVFYSEIYEAAHPSASGVDSQSGNSTEDYAE